MTGSALPGLPLPERWQLALRDVPVERWIAPEQPAPPTEVTSTAEGVRIGIRARDAAAAARIARLVHRDLMHREGFRDWWRRGTAAGDVFTARFAAAGGVLEVEVSAGTS